LGMHCTILHITSTSAPKIVRFAWLFYWSFLNSQSLWWRIYRNNCRGFSTASKTTSALLQIRFHRRYD
jgi:hypothetical protein